MLFRSGDVEEALRVETTEVAGVEPAVLQRLGIGLGIVVVAGEDGGAAHADLALLAGRQALAGCVLDGDLHAGARIAAGADRHGVVVETVQLAWQHGDVAGDLAEAVVRSEEHTSELQSLMRISY